MATPQLRVQRWHGIVCGDNPEEGFHQPRGCEGYQNATCGVADMSPDVRQSSRGHEGVAGAEVKPLIPDFHYEVTLQHVEPLVLIVVKVTRWAALRVKDVLEHEQFWRVDASDLEVDSAHAQPPSLVEAVRAGGDDAHVSGISGSIGICCAIHVGTSFTGWSGSSDRDLTLERPQNGVAHTCGSQPNVRCPFCILHEQGRVRSQRRTVRPTKKPKASMSVTLVLPRMITVTSASR